MTRAESSVPFGPKALNSRFSGADIQGEGRRFDGNPGRAESRLYRTMSVFSEISPGLIEKSDLVGSVMEQFLQNLPERLQREYRSSIRDGEAKTSLNRSGVRWILQNYFMFAGFLQGLIRLNRRPLFAFGGELLTWNDMRQADFASDISQAVQGELYRPESISRRGTMYLEITGVVPEPIRDIADNALADEIVPFAESYFFFLPTARDIRRVDILSEAENRCHEILNDFLREGISVVLTHFRFQDMRVYFEMSGEFRSLEFMNIIDSQIRGRMGPDDIIVHLSPLSSLIFSPNVSLEEARARFESLFFQIKSLIIDYDLEFAMADSLPIRLGDLWRELKM